MATPIEQLGKGGLNTDLPPMIVPQNTFTDVLNVRFDDEAVSTITGESIYRTVSIAPDYGIHWRRPDQGYNIFAKDGNVVRVDAAGNQSTMYAGTGGSYTNSDWQGTLFNGGYAIVLNNGRTTPIYCLYGDINADSAFLPLPNWNYSAGLTITAKVVRSLNYSLVAANLTIANSTTGVTTYAPSTVRVSAQAATGAIPTEWQPTTATDTADEFEINATSPILDMAELRGNMFIYSSDSISLLSIGNVTSVKPYSKSYGILNTDCVTEFDGNHFVVDRNDFYVHNGSGAIQVIGEARVKEYFFNNLNKAQTNKVKVVKNPFYKEIWVCFPKGTSTNCNEALVYQYKTNTWSKRQLPNTTYIFQGPSVVGTSFSYAVDYLYFLMNNTKVLISTPDYTMWNGTEAVPFLSYIEKKKLNTGDITGSSYVPSIYFVFDNVPSLGQVKINVTGQNNFVADSDLTQSDNEFVFIPDNAKSQGYKVDPRVNGRILNMRISAYNPWRLSTFNPVVTPVDRR